MLDTVNLVCTIISIMATCISIGYSLRAKSDAKKAEQYKKDALLLRDTFDLVSLNSKFQTESESFLEKTRKPQWNRGVETSPIISPFKGVLSSFGRVYHLVNDPKGLREKVHMLNEIVQTYHKANTEEKKQVNSLIMEITEILQREVIHNRDKITGSSEICVMADGELQRS